MRYSVGGHAGATTSLKLTFHLDHSAGLINSDSLIAPGRKAQRIASKGIPMFECFGMSLRGDLRTLRVKS
jgi:hypothetical protein